MTPCNESDVPTEKCPACGGLGVRGSHNYLCVPCKGQGVVPKEDAPAPADARRWRLEGDPPRVHTGPPIYPGLTQAVVPEAAVQRMEAAVAERDAYIAKLRALLDAVPEAETPRFVGGDNPMSNETVSVADLLSDVAIEAMVLAAGTLAHDDGHTDTYYRGLMRAAIAATASPASSEEGSSA